MIYIHILADNGFEGSVRVDELVLDTAKFPLDAALATIRPVLAEVIEHRHEKNPADA